MMRVARTLLVAALGIFVSSAAFAQSDTCSNLSAPVSSSDVSAAIVAARSVLPGTYTVASLPDPTTMQGRYAFVTNLGGGADMVLSDGSYWKHIRQGVQQDVPGGGAITLTPLLSPPIIRITGSSVASTNVTIATANLYPGATFRIIIPGVLATLATFGIQVAGTGNILSQTGASWQDLQWNGTQLIKIAGGTL